MDPRPRSISLGTDRLGGVTTPAEHPPATAPFEPATPEVLRDRIDAALRTCYDPELPVNICELGLIYGCDVSEQGVVIVRMTLTSPGCPVAGSLVQEIQSKVQALPGVKKATVELVWDPPWTKDRMSEAARLQLGLY